jgi:hypothetical protein
MARPGGSTVPAAATDPAGLAHPGAPGNPCATGLTLRQARDWPRYRAGNPAAGGGREGHGDEVHLGRQWRRRRHRTCMPEALVAGERTANVLVTWLAAGRPQPRFPSGWAVLEVLSRCPRADHLPAPRHQPGRGAREDGAEPVLHALRLQAQRRVDPGNLHHITGTSWRWRRSWLGGAAVGWLKGERGIAAFSGRPRAGYRLDTGVCSYLGESRADCSGWLFRPVVTGA